MSWRTPANLAWLDGIRGVVRDHPLARHTSFNIGGPAERFVASGRPEALVEECQRRGIPYLLLGAGTNLLVADAGVEGLVVRCVNREWRVEGTRVHAQAGLKMMRLARICADHDLTGFEWAIGVPGTVGGAVYQNAGCWGVELVEVLEEAEGLLPGRGRQMWSRDELGLGYRTSALRDGALEGALVDAARGGASAAEREVPVRPGTRGARALTACGHRAEQLDMDLEIWDRLRGGAFDCVFVALHGRLGEDGTVQGMLELLGLPYTGSGVLASALCMDKARAGAVLAAAGLDVPEFDELEVKEGVSADTVEQLIAKYGLPLVIKPVREGSTIGLTIARDADAVASGIVLASKYDRRVLAQRFQEGTEITVGVLATPDIQVLPTLEIVSDNPVYDYDAKYTAGKSHHIIPARIPERAREEAQRDAGVAFPVLGCSGMARVDIIVDADGTPWLLEVNTVPGLTALSLLPDVAKAAGISFTELCKRLIDHAVARHQNRIGPTSR